MDLNKLNKLLYVAGFAYVVAIQYGYTKGYQKGIADYSKVLDQWGKSIERTARATTRR